ncbi:hypothetical protein BKE38_27490 [Pseudoroseomonas deserti]|uniref:Uncharacterized protein n=1 Tax=Teichococcus deserti TaxID=1817963 RepID=A0A1V2GUR0_9PROT|nr:hypothetical protein [Pseudoroseomonas deserti]ONG44710.1 hypothetical protein BKE38_27490 [Pseudoroseomonas deserti]
MATHGLPTWPWTDASTEALPAAESLLLEAMRRWAEAAQRGRPALAAACLPLIAEDLAEAAPWLDAVLRLGDFGIGSPLQPRLTGQEPALLLAFALAQRSPRREALAGFLRLLPTISAHAAMGPGLALGLAFRRRGLLLANPFRNH